MDRLLEDVEIVSSRGELKSAEITSVEYDSRRVRKGALFCCIVGEHSDGHDYAPDALRDGAQGLLVERELALDVPQAIVRPACARRAMAKAASALNGHPARSLRTVGVTGTNGKTTVTHLLASIFEADGTRTSVIGTLGGARTTPEAPVLQRLLATARDSGRAAVAMEVSSHALTQDRVEGIRFDAAVFTNLGHDHLDHHRTMEEYFAAKASLFRPERARLGVVSSDDKWGRRLLSEARIEVVPFSGRDAHDVSIDAGGTRFTWRGHQVEIALSGLFQVANALAAATTASALGVPDRVIVSGLSAARAVPGRFEVVQTEAPFTIVVDYAHTPEGIQVALESARKMAGEGRVIVVFGAGGERDHDKRPAMGVAAAEGADVVVVTSDNPRGEDPRSIIDDVTSEVPSETNLVTDLDRGRAVEIAFGMARTGDVVLIAGKGHETEIEVAGRRIPFDDRSFARAAARRLTEARGRGRAVRP